MPEADLSANDTEHIDLPLGQPLRLESLRQAVVPPYVMVMPFIDLPAHVQLLGRESLGEDGVHGCVFILQASQPGQGRATVGFRDLRSGQVVLSKYIEMQTPQ